MINYNFHKGPCPELEYFRISHDIALLEIHKLCFNWHLGIWNGLFLSSFKMGMLFPSNSSHLSLHVLITLITFNKYVLWSSSLCTFCHSPSFLHFNSKCYSQHPNLKHFQLNSFYAAPNLVPHLGKPMR